MDRITERLIALEIRELQLEGHHARMARQARRNGGHRVARWLRSLADRFEGRASATSSPWFEGFDGAHLG